MPRIQKSLSQAKKHICEQCEKKCATSSALDKHRRVHTEERPFLCNLCDYTACTDSALQRHTRAHLSEKPFKCPEANAQSGSGSGCNYSSCEQGAVQKHYKTVHLGERRFPCPIPTCGRKFGQKVNLTVHMKIQEENPHLRRPFKCQLCPYRAGREHHLKGHMVQIHSTERNFKCPEEGCTFAAKVKRSLTMHLESHGEKSLVCPHSKSGCEYKTKSQLCLKLHLNRHGSEKRYKCKICDYSAHDASQLVQHTRVHTGETPFKCEADGCLYQGKDLSTMRRHVKNLHEAVGIQSRPFKCSFCSFKTSRRPYLKTHQNKKHPDKNKGQGQSSGQSSGQSQDK